MSMHGTVDLNIPVDYCLRRDAKQKRLSEKEVTDHSMSFIGDSGNSEGDKDLQDTLSMFPGNVSLEDDEEELHDTLSMLPSNVIQAADIGESGDSDSLELQSRLLSIFSTNLDGDDSNDSDNESITDEAWTDLEDQFDGEFAILN
jgi:hypothetical protein